MKQLSYEDFVEKFKPKKTTDDCYTPIPVYEAVAKYVEEKYKISRNCFLRPFYPGGDYEAEEYPDGCAVVDNPPFSILSKIINFYAYKNIKYFLFAPALTLFSGVRKGHPNVCYIACQAPIIYENGANVLTSFITNMEAPGLKSEPNLRRKLMEANKRESKQQATYIYPNSVITAADLGYLSVHGISITIPAKECLFIRGLDSQRNDKKAIFGGGFLLSERAAAERAVATEWKLSHRELEAIKWLSKPTEGDEYDYGIE